MKLFNRRKLQTNIPFIKKWFKASRPIKITNIARMDARNDCETYILIQYSYASLFNFPKTLNFLELTHSLCVLCLFFSKLSILLIEYQITELNMRVTILHHSVPQKFQPQLVVMYLVNIYIHFSFIAEVFKIQQLASIDK